MSALTAIAAASGAYSAISGADNARRSRNQAADAAKAQAAAIATIPDKTSEQAWKNAADSDRMERQYNPLAQPLRDAGLRGVTEGLNSQFVDRGQYYGGSRPADSMADPSSYQVNETPYDSTYRSGLSGMFGQPGMALPQFQDYGQGGLTKSSLDWAQRQQELGGNLDPETANAATRSSAAHAARTGGGRLGLGRDLSARDLGLLSLTLAQQRNSIANQWGQASDQFGAQRAGAINQFGQTNFGLGLQQNQQRQNLGFGLDAAAHADREYAMRLQQQNIANRFQNRSFSNDQFNQDRQDYNAYQQFRNQQYQQELANKMGAAQFGQSIAKPIAGISPEGLGNVIAGGAAATANGAANSAAMGAVTAGGQMQLSGNLLSYGLNAWENRPKPVVTPQNPVYNSSSWVPPATTYGTAGLVR